jgi:Arc/MetJ-type ribon-helix-helix transcriptional regulator
MAKSISDVRKSRGRPLVNATPITVRMPPDQLAKLDAWIAAQPKPVSRPEAIRALIEAGLAAEASE